MNLPYSDKLNIAALSRLFDNKAECYKLFWFQAVLEKVCAGELDIPYEGLIDEMIADALLFTPNGRRAHDFGCFR